MRMHPDIGLQIVCYKISTDLLHFARCWLYITVIRDHTLMLSHKLVASRVLKKPSTRSAYFVIQFTSCEQVRIMSTPVSRYNIFPYFLYQFLTDKLNSVFTFETTSGYLPAGSSQNIVVRFRPVLAINYYRKITCLLQNHVSCFY